MKGLLCRLWAWQRDILKHVLSTLPSSSPHRYCVCTFPCEKDLHPAHRSPLHRRRAVSVIQRCAARRRKECLCGAVWLRRKERRPSGALSAAAAAAAKGASAGVEPCCAVAAGVCANDNYNLHAPLRSRENSATGLVCAATTTGGHVRGAKGRRPSAASVSVGGGGKCALCQCGIHSPFPPPSSIFLRPNGSSCVRLLRRSRLQKSRPVFGRCPQ